MEFKWNKIEQDAFDEIKQIVSRNTLLACPYFNEEFKIHPNAINFQLGAVVSHKSKYISFHGIKRTDA